LSQQDFSFGTLTPDLILDALESVGIYPTSGLLPLNSYENRVYQFIAEDATRYVVKFYRPARWSDAQILEEHEFIEELHEAEIPVVRALKFGGTTLPHYQGYRFSVYPSVGGRALEADQFEQLEELGRHLGRLHMVGKSKPFASRPVLVSEAIIEESVNTILACPLMPDSLRVPFTAILNPVAERLKKTDWQPSEFIRLHGDCHIGNLLWNPQGLFMLDFDDSRQGPPVQDLWMMLSGDRAQQQLQLEALVESYEEFADFNPAQLRLIEPLRTFRIIRYMAWLAQRWEDPAFPHSFSWFAEAGYWEQQILALKEQLAALDEAPLRLQPDFN